MGYCGPVVSVESIGGARYSRLGIYLKLERGTSFVKKKWKGAKYFNPSEGKDISQKTSGKSKVSGQMELQSLPKYEPKSKGFPRVQR